MHVSGLKIFSRRSQEISHWVLINFNTCYRNFWILPLNLVLSMKLIVNHIDSSRNDTWILSYLEGWIRIRKLGKTMTFHAVSFARTCLTIGKNTDIKAIKSTFDYFIHFFKDLILANFWSKSSVKLELLLVRQFWSRVESALLRVLLHFNHFIVFEMNWVF